MANGLGKIDADIMLWDRTMAMLASGMNVTARFGLVAVLIGVLAAAFSSPSRAETRFGFCVKPPLDRLCPDFPHDQVEFSRSFEYMILSNSAQEPFDIFSWQAFIALNWPMTGAQPQQSLDPADAPRRWHGFARRDQVMDLDPATDCARPDAQDGLLIGDLSQADGSVVIDRTGNFLVYDIRVNDAAAGYILDNALHTMEGQRSAQQIAFPLGSLGGERGAAPASILIKSAWRILTDGADDRFYTAPATIAVPASLSSDGQPRCISARVGLVGMHIVTRVKSGNGDEWIWSTFEHRDNAPIAGNARDVNSIYSNDLFPGGCTAPTDMTDTRFLLFDPACPDCATNLPPTGRPLWAATPPFARLGADIARASQIVRCWNIFKSTAAVNAQWQEKLSGTVWANYMLISTQWRGANKSPLFEAGEVPRYLTNTTMETYMQYDRTGSCLGCHSTARTVTGADANFTFLLSDVQ